MKTTIDTITDRRIETLRDEAAAAGDAATVRDCETALSHTRDGAARRRIVAIIREAEARAGAES